MSIWKPRLSPKQEALYDCRHRYILAEGARYCGKTWGIQHRVLRHCWRNNARVAIITKTTKQGASGVWPQLTGIIYKEWEEAEIVKGENHFGFTREPWVDAVTKVSRAQIRNRLGGVSDIHLFPIEKSHEAKAKLLSTEWSMIWISEGHLYESAEIFQHSVGQLRLAGVAFEDTELVCDTNPPEEGDAHWIYEVFHTHRTLSPDQYPEHWGPEIIEIFKREQERKAVFRFTREDNIYAASSALDAIAAIYAWNPEEYERMVLGNYTEVKATAIFRAAFSENQHVFGSATGPEEDWSVLAPSNGPHAERLGRDVHLISGWDPGDVNHSWHAVQPWRNDKDQLCYDVLDELVITGKPTSVYEFTDKVVEHADAVQELCPESTAWTDYADSSTGRFSALAGDPNTAIQTDAEMTWAGIVAQYTKGRFQFVGSAAVKKSGWQRQRCNMILRLLKENRIRISAHCFETIKMFKLLRRTLADPKHFIAPDQRFKHAFDSLSYAICMHLVENMAFETDGPRVLKPKPVIYA